MAVVMPVHGREDLTTMVRGYYYRRGINPITVGDGGEYECPNDPLGAKFNYGFQQSRRVREEGGMMVGSDDLVDKSYIHCIRKIKPVYSELRGMHFYNPATDVMVFIPGFLVGSGKYFSPEFLERCDYQPYVADKNRNLDSGPKRFLREGERMKTHGYAIKPVCIGIKAQGENMWDFDYYKDLPGAIYVNPDQAFHAIGEERDYWRGAYL